MGRGDVPHCGATPADDSSEKMASWRDRAVLPLAAVATLIAPAGAGASSASRADDGQQGVLAALQTADLRLAAIAYRLMTSNVALCDRRAAATGLVLHALTAYDSNIRPAAQRFFGFVTPIAVEGVVAGSPAADAGVHADESIASIDGATIGSDGASLGEVRARIADTPSTGVVSLELIDRGRGAREVVINPVPACAGRAELRLTDDLNAATDGLVLQVNSAMLNVIGEDDELAALVAHELAHIVLRHPERLTTAHVSRGMFSIFGRNARLIRRTEIEADRLSVVLLANAGYDPMAAARLWRNHGEELGDGGLFSGTTHLDLEDRIALVEREAALIPAGASHPIVPEWINSRDQPLH
jgi:hypothetical protein